MTHDDGVMRVLSLGAGVQSTTVALMAATGELDPIDHAIFADTGWEPAEVYAHLDKLQPVLEAAGIPVHRVSAGDLRRDHLDPGPNMIIQNPRLHPENAGKQRAGIPVYLRTPAGFDRHRGEVVPAGKGISVRQCTSNYKIEPIEKRIRELLGLKYRQRWPVEHCVDHIFGISWDETERMRDAPRSAVRNVYPLVEARLTRHDCHRWLLDHGWADVPRSACIGCPFHSDHEWRRIRDEAPDEWADAVEFDEAFRARHAAGFLTLRGEPYLHAARVPLAEAPIDDPNAAQLELFGDECSGFCGT